MKAIIGNYIAMAKKLDYGHTPSLQNYGWKYCCDKVQNQGSYAILLLMLAGDVETNPGPGT